MSLIKYNKIKLLGHSDNDGILSNGDNITIQVKMDGSNTRFMLNDGKIIFGSRSIILGTEDVYQ